MFYTQKGWRIHLPVCFHFIFMFRSQTYTEWEKMVGGHALVLKLTFTHTILLCQREMEVFFAFAHFFSPLSLWHSFSSSHLSLFGSTIYLFGWFLCMLTKRIQLQTSRIFFRVGLCVNRFFVPRSLNFQCFAFALFVQKLQAKKVVALFLVILRCVSNQCI